LEPRGSLGFPTLRPEAWPPQKMATYNTHTEALEPMAGALWNGYDVSFPAMGGGDEKALPSRRRTS
jgi:hypothetical protein